jgi:hypothetical protein
MRNEGGVRERNEGSAESPAPNPSPQCFGARVNKYREQTTRETYEKSGWRLRSPPDPHREWPVSDTRVHTNGVKPQGDEESG